jgi:disulfide bond formation protein DsbB
MYWLFTLNYLLALGGLGLLVVTFGLFVDYFVYSSVFYKKYISRVVWPILMATTVGSVGLSLLYSEYFGFIPCSLCWLQRIALYPQALMSLLAFKTKDSIYFPLYGIGLSLFGTVVGIYHYVYQMLPQEETAGFILPCLADGSADCATLVIEEFGFVTFPFLSAVTFLFLVVVYLNMHKEARR